MFLLNRVGMKKQREEDKFTIQNVPIKFNGNDQIVLYGTYLQYKMFLLNVRIKYH